MLGQLSMAGKLAAKHIRGTQPAPLTWKVRNITRPNYVFGWVGNQAARALTATFGIPTMIAELRAVKIGADGKRTDYGVVSYRKITTAYVNFLAAQHVTDSTVIGDFKFHDSGEGVTGEANGDTDMETTDGESRVTGTQTNPGSVNTYQSVGTIAYTTSKAITEHGLFSASSGATLMDRSVFAAINVVNGDSIQFTYTLTLTAGG